MKHTLILLGLLTLASCTASTAMATHCPGCDTTAPDYGSSSQQYKQENGWNFPGDGRGTPGDYWNRESNIQRDNREQQERETAVSGANSAEQYRRQSQRDNYRGNSGGLFGGDSGGQCRGLYGC